MLKDVRRKAGQCDEAICVCKLLLTEVRLLPSYQDWEIEAACPLMFTFQRMALRSLFKAFLDCKIGKSLGDDLYLKGA